jgi:hypothetical protein
MVDYARAFKRPFEDIKTLVIGMIVAILPVVNFAAIGYVLECMRTAKKRDFRLPEFKEWGNLLSRGFLFALMMVVYYLAPGTILLAILMIFGFGAAEFGDMALEDISAIGPGILGIVWLLVSLVILYILPSVMNNYTKNYRFGDGFRLREIFGNAMNKDYFITWLVFIVATAIVLAIFSVIFFLVMPAGWVLALFVMGIPIYTAFGEHFSKM